MTVYMVVAFIITYLICSVNPAIEICKLKTGEDIRKLGSGNAGTANAMRVLGKPLGTVVIICDILKVFISLAIVYVIGKIFKQDISVMLKSVFILAAVIGHCYPIYYKFRGGKGVIVGMTTAFILDAKTALICMIVGVIVILITRTVAMGTLIGTIVYVVITIFSVKECVIPVIIACSIIMFKHRANVKRILTGTENKLNFNKEKGE